MTLVVYSFNHYYLQKEFFDEKSASIEKSLVSIESNPKHIEAINLDDYQRGVNKYKDKLSIYYSKRTAIGFLTSSKQGEVDFLQIPILFISHQMYGDLLNLPREKGQYFIGSAAKEKLHLLWELEPQKLGHGSIAPGHFFEQEDGKIQLLHGRLILDGKTYTFEDLPLETEEKLLPLSSGVLTQTILSSQEIDDDEKMKNFIIMPVDDELAENPMWSTSSRVMESILLVQDQFPHEGNLWNFLQDIYLAHNGEYAYHLNEEYMQAKITLQQILDGMIRILTIAILQLLVVSCAGAALLYLFLQKRKGDIAISVMMGSTLRTQGYELLGEAVLLTLTGAMLSIVSYYIIGKFMVVSPIQGKTLLSLLGISTGMISLSVSLALSELYQLSPVEILQKK